MTTEQELPKGWKIERLGDIAISEKGKKPKNQSSEKQIHIAIPMWILKLLKKVLLKVIPME